MPSKSPAQHRLMEAAAHKKGGAGGVPQSVGKEFSMADARKKHKADRKKSLGKRIYGEADGQDGEGET